MLRYTVLTLTLFGCGHKSEPVPIRPRDGKMVIASCPLGMNEESSGQSGGNCGAGGQVDVAKQSGGVTVTCSNNASISIKCTLPAECKYGFEIISDSANASGRLKCGGPPASATVDDPCMKHRIRSQGSYNSCLRQCQADYDNGIGKCNDDGCRGGTDNARKGCLGGCSGSMQEARRAGCCPDCQ